jgi:glycosyltransferase involved in cell wall biosynthesis
VRTATGWLAAIQGGSADNSRLSRRLRLVESPRLLWSWWRGREYFDYPGTGSIPSLPPSRPDIIHCHNLHGGYFDLRKLAKFSRSFPVLLTLHDEWLLTGHCAGTLGCERWRIGCGSCPDLTIYPAVRRDATDDNWKAKRAIYAESRLYVSGPSNWLIDRARESMLAAGTVRWRVIPNGVDRSIFRPGDRIGARSALSIPDKAVVLLFAADWARSSSFKDYPTVLAAARDVATSKPTENVLLLVLGDTGESEHYQNLEVRFLPYESDLERVRTFYQAADVLLHGAKAETGGLTVMEALASGLPVVATAVGGLPEAVRSLAGAPGGWAGASAPIEEATGVLVEPGDAQGMAAAASALLADPSVLHHLSTNGVKDAAARFDIERVVDVTVDWYREILDDWRRYIA